MARQPLLTLLHRDERLVAIDKPPGLASVPGRGEPDSALHAIARQLGLPHSGADDPRVRLVHRLDKDTSGVLLFALDLATARHLSHEFQNNRPEKQYLALVAGAPAEDEGSIDTPIAVHPADRTRMIATRHGRRALTLWRVEQRYRDHALLRVFPRTGKTHQIRVHLLSIGLPLAVDPLYNPQPEPGVFLSRFKRGYRAKPDATERPLIARLTLHAERIHVDMPGGTSCDIDCPPPKDFRAAVAMLGKYARR